MYLVEWQKSKTLITVNAGKNLEEQQTLSIVSETGTVKSEDSLVVSKRTKHTLTIKTGNLAFRHLLR